MYCNIVSDSITTELFTASLIGYVLLMHVKEFGQLFIGISSLQEKISRGLYYERMKLSYLCTAEYNCRYMYSVIKVIKCFKSPITLAK